MKQLLTAVVCGVLFLCLPACNKGGQGKKEQKKSSSEKQRYHIEIIKSAAGGYGYNIYVNKKLKIHQPMVPGKKGLRGFRSKLYAMETAKLVVKKLKTSNAMPTVIQKEIDSIYSLGAENLNVNKNNKK